MFGAGYTDVTITRWALWAAAVITVAFAVGLYILASRGRAGRLPILLGGFAGGMVALLGFLPLPSSSLWSNELELETPYLRRNIAFTRAAFGLETVEERAYSAARARCGDDRRQPRHGRQYPTLGLAALESRPSSSCNRSAPTIRSSTLISTDTALAITTAKSCCPPASSRVNCPARA